MNTKFSMMVTSQEGERQWRGHGKLQKMEIHIYLHYKYKYMHAVLSITKKYIFTPVAPTWFHKLHFSSSDANLGRKLRLYLAINRIGSSLFLS